MRLIEIDVTDNIIGKLNKDLKVELFYLGEKIGFYESQKDISFNRYDFNQKNGRILKTIDDVKVSQYVEHCDMGWC